MLGLRALSPTYSKSFSYFSGDGGAPLLPLHLIFPFVFFLVFHWFKSQKLDGMEEVEAAGAAVWLLHAPK